MGRPWARCPHDQVAQPLGGCLAAVSPGRERSRGPERQCGAGIDRNEAVAQRDALAPDMIDHRMAFDGPVRIGAVGWLATLAATAIAAIYVLSH
jgi:hypothetical protein